MAGRVQTSYGTLLVLSQPRKVLLGLEVAIGNHVNLGGSWSWLRLRAV